MDKLNKLQRSKCMSQIRGKNTVPELIVRKILTELNTRYRLHAAYLPGKPDIILVKKKLIILVNGCFWHQHQGCKKRYFPSTNIDYWRDKLRNNIERQKNNISDLNNSGWTVEIIWECETKDKPKLTLKLEKILKMSE